MYISLSVTRSCCAVLVGLVLLIFAPQARAGLITNGGFETGDFTGWTVSGGARVLPLDKFSPHSGSFFADLGNSGSLGTLSQTVSDTAEQIYTLNFYLGSDGETPNEFKIQWDGTTLYDQTNLPITLNNANPYNLLSFTVTGTGSDTLTLFQRNDPGLLALDDVGLAAVPEPGAMTLIGIGAALCMAGYGWQRRHRKQAVTPCD